MRSPAAARIILNLPELARLAKHQPIVFKLAGMAVEVAIDDRVTPRLLIGQMLDLLQSGEPSALIDPPEAREFLRNRRHGKPGK